MSSPHTVMSVDPQSNIVDVILGIVKTATFKRCNQNWGKQLKPCVTDALEGPWSEESIEKIKFFGFDTEAQDSICLYFDNCFKVQEARTHTIFSILFNSPKLKLELSHYV